jgi:hypothetical protein
MKKFFMFMLLSFLMLFSCGEEEVQTSWNSYPIRIDGESDDWDKLPVLFSEDLDVAYGIANNDSTLSVMIRFNDQRLARMISLRGFTIRFFPPDKDGKEFAIHYQGFNAVGAKNHETYKKFIPAGMFTIVREEGEPGWPLKKIPGIKAAYSFFDGFYCIEYQIPLFLEKSSPFAYNLKGKDELEIEFVLEEMDKSRMQAMRSSMGGRGGMAGGSMGGGGMPGGGMGGGMGRGGGMRGGGMGGGLPDMSAKETTLIVKLARPGEK